MKTTNKQVRKELKGTLNDYFTGKLDTKIKIEERKANQEFSLRAVKYDQAPAGKKNEINRTVEKFNLKKEQAKERMQQLKTIRENIKSALSTLSEKEYKLIKLSFVKENYTIRQIAAKLGWAESTIANKKGDILDELGQILGMN